MMGCGASSESATERISVDEMILKDYLQIEREIAEAEINNPVKPLDLKAEQLGKIQDDIQRLQENVKNIEVQATSFGSKTTDAVETHKYFIENGISNELTPAQEQYMDLLSKKEISKKELETARKQEKKLTGEMEELEEKAQYLQELYKRQDSLLDRIFGGQYGSLQENQLENELDYLEAQRGRILEANFKWRQAQMMLEYACKQLAVAVQKWQDLPTIPVIDLEIRYSVAAETRNNLVASGQNMAGAQRYLESVQFPYCDPSEVATLNKAAQYVFTDMQSTDRHNHAQECYTTTHKRANALLQWFDNVINSTIMKDLYEINEKVKEKTLELRKERVRLIKQRIQELYGKELMLDETLRGRDIDVNELALAMLNDNQVVKVDGADVESERAGTPTPLTKEELAPVPSNTVIFGSLYENYQNQIKDLQSKHRNELSNFMKEQEMIDQKMRGKLEEKLVLRRQRRARANIERMQKEVL